MHLYKWVLTPEESAQPINNDLYLVHQAVYSLFPGTNQPRTHLYRRVGSDILIQSPEPITKNPSIGRLLSTCIPDSLEGQYQLKATLNPVVDKSRMAEGKKNSARVPLVKESDILAWAKDRLSKNGFSLQSLAVSPTTRHVSRFKGITIDTVEVTGVVTVIDASKANVALLKGIGKEKAFGCGLLCLTSINNSSSDESEESDD